MKLNKLSCPNCGSNLDLNTKEMIAFCPYCGQKLHFDSEKLYTEKIKQSERTERKRIEKEYDLKMQKQTSRDLLVFYLFGFLMIVLMAILGQIYGWFG